MKISCLIVDDVKLNRQAMHDLIAEFDFLEDAGECSNADEAMKLLNEFEPDVIFLDIEMPGVSGLEFLKSLPNPPLTVITTSHREFAVEGYEMNVFDYLVKPITRERFQKCASRIEQNFRAKRKSLFPDLFFLKVSNRYVRIRYDEIKYIEAMRDFVVIYLDQAKHVTMQTLKSFASKLPEDQFIRVHRSYVVSIHRIEAIEGSMIKIQEQKIPISDTYREHVIKTLLGGNE
jgi:DNA-binding LytR/AlgR family response regulator